MIISIDPANVCGVALFDDTKLIDAWTLNYDLMAFKDYLTIKFLDRVVIEGQYYHRNIKTFMDIAEKRIAITTICQLYGIPYTVILPSKWQTILDISRTTPRAMRKELSLKHASAIAGMSIIDNNIADAINLGWYYITHKEEL